MGFPLRLGRRLPRNPRPETGAASRRHARQISGIKFEARAYVDTGPIVERVAAKYAGIGWLAKNTCLINEGQGSWLFLGVILTTLDLEPTLAAGQLPPPDLCGNCRLCIDACPTEAITAPYLLTRAAAFPTSPSNCAARSPKIPPRHGQHGLWLRYLPGRLPLEPQRPLYHAPGIHAQKIPLKNADPISTAQQANSTHPGGNEETLYAPPLNRWRI